MVTRILRLTWLARLLLTCVAGELLQNGGFESTANWDCWGIQCALTDNKHSGQHALEVQGRQETWQGPSQNIEVVPDHTYAVSGYIRLMNDDGQGQTVQLEVNFKFADGPDDYVTAATHSGARVSDGWIHLTGSFSTPNKQVQSARVYYQGPGPSVSFIVDDASVVPTSTSTQSQAVDDAIDRLRKSDIHLHVTTASGIDKKQVQIKVVQKKKAFPFGMALSAPHYTDPSASMDKYRDFVHRHFNWAVPGNALKWYSIERVQGERNYKPALDMIDGLHKHGIKVRGHCLLWSDKHYVQAWVQALSAEDLRRAIEHHVNDTLSVTHGLVEHWDVNNEILHGHWYQDTLHDPSFSINFFREVHRAEPRVKLFLNEYNVVAWGDTTDAYLQQAKQFKAANVGLYGLGAQCHFGNEQEPVTSVIWERLDKLAQAGLPIWATELDVFAQDENKRADFYEKAIKALYGHPAVEGILLWGFWDKAHWRGEPACLLKGDNFEMTAAGRRVVDLLDNKFVTDEMHVLAEAGDQFTVRGFHGDYEVHVLYQGQELSHATSAVTLGKSPLTVNLNVHL